VKRWGWPFDVETPPLGRSSPNPKNSFGRKKDNKNKYVRTNFQQQQARETQGFILRFNSPLRLVYILIIEVTTKVRVSFTSLPHSSNYKGKLEFFTRKHG
jgi:hypothetical protein